MKWNEMCYDDGDGGHLHSQFARSGHKSLRTSMLRRPWEVWRITIFQKKKVC
jgi:hypothetical protein